LCINSAHQKLWDTAGTERFRSVSRSYYRGAAGALLVYDITSLASFGALSTFVNDARALASPNLSFILVGNKADLAQGDGTHASGSLIDTSISGSPPVSAPKRSGLGAQNTLTKAPEGREVSTEEASVWASSHDIPVAVEVSAFSGENVEDIFTRLARMILTKIELGEIDPDDPQSGIQYGDSSNWAADNASIRSGMTLEDGRGRRRKGRPRGTSNAWMGGMREWDDVFRLEGRSRRRCC
jgi:GTPase SAR1 family protein